jgi:hypothetical protein
MSTTIWTYHLYCILIRDQASSTQQTILLYVEVFINATAKIQIAPKKRRRDKVQLQNKIK